MMLNCECPNCETRIHVFVSPAQRVATCDACGHHFSINEDGYLPGSDDDHNQLERQIFETLDRSSLKPTIACDERLLDSISEKMEGLKEYCKSKQIHDCVEKKVYPVLEVLVDKVIRERSIQLSDAMSDIVESMATWESSLRSREFELAARVERVVSFEQHLLRLEGELQLKAQEVQIEASKIRSVKDSLSLLLGRPINSDIQIPKVD